LTIRLIGSFSRTHTSRTRQSVFEAPWIRFVEANEAHFLARLLPSIGYDTDWTCCTCTTSTDDLHEFIAKIWHRLQDVWNETKGEALWFHRNCTAPYFCFIPSSGIGKIKLLDEFSRLVMVKSKRSGSSKSQGRLGSGPRTSGTI
jgi:hypothetical protein